MAIGSVEETRDQYAKDDDDAFFWLQLLCFAVCPVLGNSHANMCAEILHFLHD